MKIVNYKSQDTGKIFISENKLGCVRQETVTKYSWLTTNKCSSCSHFTSIIGQLEALLTFASQEPRLTKLSFLLPASFTEKSGKWTMEKQTLPQNLYPELMCITFIQTACAKARHGARSEFHRLESHSTLCSQQEN